MSTQPGTPQVLFTGEHLQLLRHGRWEYVQRRTCSGVVVIVAVTPEDRLLLVEQFRPPVARRVIELPAGLAGDIAGQEDEQLATAARRELLEETGFEAATIESLTVGPPSAGLSNELITFVRASGLRRVGPGGGDASEDITVHERLVDEVPAWLAQRHQQDGVLVDPKVYAGLFFARPR